MTDTTSDLALLVHELGHSAEQARQGAAVVSIEHGQDHLGGFAHCRAYTIGPSGLLLMDSDDWTLAAGAAWTIATVDGLSDAERLRVAPMALAICSRAGVAVDDLRDMGGTITKEAVKASVYHVMLAMRHRMTILAEAERLLPDFAAKRPIRLVGERLRDLYFRDPLPDQLLSIYPALRDKPTSLAKMANSLSTEPLLRPTRLGFALDFETESKLVVE